MRQTDISIGPSALRAEVSTTATWREVHLDMVAITPMAIWLFCLCRLICSAVCYRLWIGAADDEQFQHHLVAGGVCSTG